MGKNDPEMNESWFGSFVKMFQYASAYQLK